MAGTETQAHPGRAVDGGGVVGGVPMRTRELAAARRRADAAGDRRLGQVPQRWKMAVTVTDAGVRATVEVTYVTGVVVHSIGADGIAELTEKLRERGLV